MTIIERRDLVVTDISSLQRPEVGSLGSSLNMVTQYIPDQSYVSPERREVLETWRFTLTPDDQGALEPKGQKLIMLSETLPASERELRLGELMLFSEMAAESLGFTPAVNGLIHFAHVRIEEASLTLRKYGDKLDMLRLTQISKK